MGPFGSTAAAKAASSQGNAICGGTFTLSLPVSYKYIHAEKAELVRPTSRLTDGHVEGAFQHRRWRIPEAQVVEHRALGRRRRRRRAARPPHKGPSEAEPAAGDEHECGVAVNLDVQYASSAKSGEVVEWSAKMLKRGGRLASVEVRATGKNGRLVAVGTVTKSLRGKPKPK